MIADPSKLDQTVVAVLAGGRGSRMGGGKPTALLAGRPLVAYPLAAAAQVGLRAVVIAKPSTPLPRALEVEVLYEPEDVFHPLLGLITALTHFPRVLAVGCDMPFMSGAELAWLASQPQTPALIELAGRLQPFPSLHSDAELPALTAALTAQASLRRTFADLRPLRLDEVALAHTGAPALNLVNVNTAEDLRAVETELSGRDRQHANSQSTELES